MAMLEDLLYNTLDAGYQDAADRPKQRHWWDRPAVAGVCLVLGLLLVTSYQQNHRSAPARDAARKELIARITALQKSAAGMDAQAKELAAQVAALRDAQLSGAGQKELRALEILSGAIAVKGPGIEITVSEPALTAGPTGVVGRPGTGLTDAAIHDYDLQRVANELWSAGAEAIAINGIRLAATSTIRVAGESILVDQQPISSPYTVDALGDGNALQVGFADSSEARRLKTLQAVNGVGFSFGGRSSLTLPSVTVGDLSYASVGPAPSPRSPVASSSGPAPSPQPSESPS